MKVVKNAPPAKPGRCVIDGKSMMGQWDPHARQFFMVRDYAAERRHVTKRVRGYKNGSRIEFYSTPTPLERRRLTPEKFDGVYSDVTNYMALSAETQLAQPGDSMVIVGFSPPDSHTLTIEDSKKIALLADYDLTFVADNKLPDYGMGTLRKYAGKVLGIVGASKIPGGKPALIERIIEVRRG